MKLDDIGFYTLTNDRVKGLAPNSPIMRAEIILTDKCNLRCPYCRGLSKDLVGELPKDDAFNIIKLLCDNDTRNIRFSGGEPTMYPHLYDLVWTCKQKGMDHIAISTNGTANLKLYKSLLAAGVNDFSISLDAGCCSMGTKMVGGNRRAWNKASYAIAYLSQSTYVTVGVVFNEVNYADACKTLSYIDSLCPSDIRIISSAQYNQALEFVTRLSSDLVNRYPILKYRVSNYRRNIPIRGISSKDSHKCYLVMDDVAIAQQYHFPCIIYMREMGKPIGVVGKDMRADRHKWFLRHDTHTDKICRENCLDVCVAHNNRCEEYLK